MTGAKSCTAAALATVAVLISIPVAAQSATDFYGGKQIDMFIGTPTGGGYDQYGRLLAHHMGRHIPGTPTIVVKNMPAGGGRQALNHVYTTSRLMTAPRSAPRSATSRSIRCSAKWRPRATP